MFLAANQKPQVSFLFGFFFFLTTPSATSSTPASPVAASPTTDAGAPLPSPHRLPRSGTPPTTSLPSTANASPLLSPRLKREGSKGSLPLAPKVSPRPTAAAPGRPALHLPSFRRRGATSTSPRTGGKKTFVFGGTLFFFLICFLSRCIAACITAFRYHE